jgi:hypothetical protein
MWNPVLLFVNDNKPKQEFRHEELAALAHKISAIVGQNDFSPCKLH